MNEPTPNRPISCYENAQELFDAYRPSGSGHVGLCRAHDDHHPSLSLWERDDESGVLVKCHAGCDEAAVLAAFSLGHWTDLLYEGSRPAAPVPVTTWPLPAAAESWDAADLLAARFPVHTWPVPGLIPPGVGLLVAAPKTGKSFLALSLAIAVGLGRVALGRFPTNGGRVLALFLEDGPRRVQDRLRLMPESAALEPGRLTIRTTADRVGEGLVELLDTWRARGDAPVLVIIDVLQQVRPPETRKDRPRGVYADDYAALASVREWATRYGVSVLVVHHTRKQEAKDPLDLISGSNGLSGVVDYAAVLQRDRNQPHGVLFVVGRDVEDVQVSLKFDRGRWSAVDIPARLIAATGTRAHAFRLLRDEGRQTTGQVAERLHITRSTAQKALERLVKDGDVVRHNQPKPGTPVVWGLPSLSSVSSVARPAHDPEGSQEAQDIDDTDDADDRREAGGEPCLLCRRPTFLPDHLHEGCRDLVVQLRAPGSRAYRWRDPAGSEDAVQAEVSERWFVSDVEFGYIEDEDPVLMARLAEPCPEAHDSWGDPGSDVPPLALRATDDGWQAFYVCPVEGCHEAWASTLAPFFLAGTA